ncbi:MAG TPA: RES family NAD+ phosphorylase, partial [Polyangiaceae bacterium LLY-WYZ-14_1]|nr:RES family NAD+ phosphorylase [Polyangiaceae bacterium LLY-WYZ-14_1]
MVEAQHLASTRKLVDSAAEQDVLEDVLEASKPPLPRDGAASLHYLLRTPFRYPPLRHGSRYGRPHERGIFYGSATLRTAFAEVAYYRLLFLSGTAGDLPTLHVELSAFRASLRTDRGVDLTAPPFRGFRHRLASPTDYTETQALGTAMREAGVEAFRAPSARDPEGGDNIGAFTPRVFGRRRPSTPETWLGTVAPDGVELRKKDFFETRTIVFPRRVF